MKYSHVLLSIVLGTSLVGPACASGVPPERIAYVTARPYGWVELTIADLSIPRVPVGREDAREWARPNTCSLEVMLDGEPWFSGLVYPQGDEPPYRANSGFRFPAPKGEVVMRVLYSGCRVQDDSRVDVDLFSGFVVQDASVHEFVFDGSELRAEPVRSDPTIQLRDVYQELLRQREQRKSAGNGSQPGAVGAGAAATP